MDHDCSYDRNAVIVLATGLRLTTIYMNRSVAVLHIAVFSEIKYDLLWRSHSTEVTFTLLTLPARVQYLARAFPDFLMWPLDLSTARTRNKGLIVVRTHLAIVASATKKYDSFKL